MQKDWSQAAIHASGIVMRPGTLVRLRRGEFMLCKLLNGRRMRWTDDGRPALLISMLPVPGQPVHLPIAKAWATIMLSGGRVVGCWVGHFQLVLAC
jgi:hypothetical protein